jgi:hypothetical protein
MGTVTFSVLVQDLSVRELCNMSHILTTLLGYTETTVVDNIPVKFIQITDNLCCLKVKL